ncbi:hypothetical protein NADFUDRAFT_47642 [Nadsonia fulvescens var. elongata DSM 6958]|uniref:Ctf8-domain-containing protein n=1 Tax=Nadsonia fulvescens var. elongata DSM 6958 TaxID=857566 RepID=A0A1E3PEG2_9ASCO|nr:hypothetical protein NADFUDRAFT_47642 [Nadsonia fulvescens var. elongata DSM 6958]
MPQVEITLRRSNTDDKLGQSYIPQVLKTPSGLILVEIQGVLHIPDIDHDDSGIPNVLVGSFDVKEDGKALLMVHGHQRLEGTVKKLQTPLGILKMESEENESNRHNPDIGGFDSQGRNYSTQRIQHGKAEIVEIIRHKVSFILRPEPVV